MIKQLCNWLTSLVALTLLTCASVLADEAASIAKVEEVGGTIRTIAKDTDQKEAAFHLSGKDVGDDGIAALADIPNLVWLNLRGTKVTDAGLAHLANIKTLTKLHLEQTAITDAGLAQLSGLENLEYLNLYGTKVTDAGLAHLQNLKKLKKLYVWQTEVTKAGADQLLANIPGLYINRGADAEPGPPTKAIAQGRYVKVRLEGEKRILSLAEVQVIETASGKELQTAGQATQSSNYEGNEPKRANDGNVDGVYDKGSVSHTAEETNPWWLLDLGSVQDIGKIAIHNRADCCGDRLEGAIVEVFDASLSIVFTGKVDGATDGSVKEFVAE
ncbi:MAG: hypothetical protein KDA92_06670 [Planctomycetales bacterium]|nr:hypothetical protein [Planctomycetales bacterium]